MKTKSSSLKSPSLLATAKTGIPVLKRLASRLYSAVKEDFWGYFWLGVNQVMGVASFTECRFQSIAAPPHVSLPASAGPIQRPQGFSKQLAGSRQSKRGDETITVSELLKPPIRKQGTNDHVGQVYRVTGFRGIELVLPNSALLCKAELRGS